jgi:hypothetical protein
MPVPQDQGDQLELPRAQTQDGAPGADSPGAADRPARGSTADLRQRLERLPQGHPSSPYHDDGTPKPPLARLKNLELPLPGEEREPNGGARRDASGAQVTPRTGDRAAVADAAAGIASYPDPEVQDRQPVVREPDPAEPRREPERREPADPEAASDEPVGWDHLFARETTWNRPAPQETDQLTARDRPSAQETTWGHAPESHDQPGARETAWDRPAAQETSWGQSPDPRNQPDARETVWGHSPEPQDQPDAQEHEREDHGEELAAEREDDLDDEPATQDQPALLDDQAPRPADQPDARRGENLTPEQVRLAVRTLGQCRLAEGRSVFGSYGDSGLTPAMRRIEDQLEHGELVPETEKYALKSLDSFQDKLTDMIADEPGTSPEELADRVHDGIRYTFLFDTENYAHGVQDGREKLTEHGYSLQLLRNTWDQEQYKGINSRWLDPASGKMFEVQFHTPHSWEAKQQTHDAYKRIKALPALSPDRQNLKAFQREVTTSIPIPSGCLDIDNYPKEG